MQEYEIFNFYNDINEKVILMTSTEDLYYLQDEIFDNLSKIKGENFTVLVDLFLRNGFSFNRFVSLSYKGKNQCKAFIVNPREVSEEIKAKIRSYLKSNINILEKSALSQNTVNFIKTTPS